MKHSPKKPTPATRRNAAQHDAAGDPHTTARTPAGGLGQEVHAYDDRPVIATGGGIMEPSPGVTSAEVEVVMETGMEAVAQQFAKARTFFQAAKVAAAQSVAFMILCGHELNRLHKELGFERGRPSAEKCANGGTIKFEDLAERYAGLPPRTAYRWRELAREARKRIPLLDAEEMLSTPLAMLPEPRQENLLKAVQKATDGKTAQQLMWDWGLATGAPHARGRKPGDGGRPNRGNLSVSEQAEIMREAAHRDWVQIHEMLAYYGASFTHLDDTEIEIQLALLRAAVKARQTWLKERAPHNRNLDAVKAILAEAN